MMTEGRAGFRAFHEGSKERREVDFLALRRDLADGGEWNRELLDEVLATVRGEGKRLVKGPPPWSPR